MLGKSQASKKSEMGTATKGKTSSSKKSQSNENEEKKDDNALTYLEYENFGYIHSNLEDYATVDGNRKGEYLIRGMKQVFALAEIEDMSLDMIVHRTRRMVQDLVSNYGTSSAGTRQVVDFTSNFNYRIFFKKKLQKNVCKYVYI